MNFIKMLGWSSMVAALAISGNIVLADSAPVVDLTHKDQSSIHVDAQDGNVKIAQPSSTQVEVAKARVTKLEQQLKNITDMNLPEQINELQQQMAQLRGQLQVQERDISLLETQVRRFYKDLDQRITQVQNASGSESSTTTPSSSNTSNAQNTSAQNDMLSLDSIQLKDSHAYQTAFDALSKGSYDQAESAFNDYLNAFPNGSYVANAHYWLGEIYLNQHNKHKATMEFNTVINKYPKSDKVSDARLKLAAIQAKMGQVASAKKQLELIKQKHPGTTTAQLANIRLQQLNHVSSNFQSNSQ